MSFLGAVQRTARFSALAIGVMVVAACSGGAKTAATSGTPTAADLIVSVSKPTIQNAGTDTSVVTVTAVDSNRNIVAEAPVTIVPDSNAVIAVSGAVTDTSGIVTGTIGVGSDRSNRTINIVVTSGGITKTTTIGVIGAKLIASAVQTVLAPGASGSISYHLVDANNADMANMPITVQGPTTVQGTTDVNGKYTYTYTAPATIGVVQIVASAGGSTVQQDITVASGTVPPATGVVRSASLDANPSNVNVNTPGSTANQVEVRALFVGDNNVPIPNVRVRFDLNGDVNGVGGMLTAGSGSGDAVYSDANGVARTTYIPGTRASGNQKLTIRGCWSNNDFAPVASGAACPNGQEITASVTVVDAGVSVSILTNGLITPIDEKSVYQLDFAVQVVDSVGQPKSGVTVKGSVDLPRYYKGAYAAGGSQWNLGHYTTDINGQIVWAPGYSVCENEDVNRNNLNETYSNGNVEDADGARGLEPHPADTAIVLDAPGNAVTDAFGKAYFHLQYGQNVASWVDYTLTFSAIVQGTEGHQSLSGNLPIPSSILKAVDVDPPFRLSPYGVELSNTIAVTDPATSKTASLCTNPN